jgi:ABC-type iron transport system FetAB permease component
MKLFVVLQAKWELEPRYVVSTANMVLFDMFVSAANEAQAL